MARSTPTRRYRCYLQLSTQPAETGVLPFVQLRAQNAEQAARAAQHVTGATIVEVERLEDRS